MLPSFSDILLDDGVLGNECLIEDEELGEVVVNGDGLLYNKDQLSGGQWVTIGGAHVYIKGGKIAAGPAVFKGKTLKQATAHATKVKKDVASAAKKVDKTGSKVEKAKAALEKAKAELKKHSGGLATVKKQIKQTKVKSTAAQAAVSKAQKGKVTASTDIHDHIRKTNELTRKSVAGTLRPDEVEAHIKSLNKLNKDQVLRLAEATNISGNKTKKAALEAISNKLQGQGGSRQSSLGGSSKTQSAAQMITGKEQHGKAIGKALDDAMARIKAGGDHKAETAEVHRQVDDAFKGVRLKAHAEAIARGFGILPKGTITQTKDAIKDHATARVGGYLRSQLVNRPGTTSSTASSGSTTGAGTVSGTSAPREYIGGTPVYKHTEARNLPNSDQLLRDASEGHSLLSKSQAGVVRVGDLYNNLKAKHPGLSLEDFHRQILHWEKDDKITVGLVNDPRLEHPSNFPGMMRVTGGSKRGQLQGYVIQVRNVPSTGTTGKSTGGTSTAGTPTSTTGTATGAHSFSSRTPDEHHAVYEALGQEGISGKWNQDRTAFTPKISAQEYQTKVEAFGQHLDRTMNKNQANELMTRIGYRGGRSKKDVIKHVKDTLIGRRGAFMRAYA